MIRTFASAMCALLISTSAFADSIEQRVLNNFIVPGYQAFEVAADSQVGTMEALCAAPDAQTLSTARLSFGDLVTRWSHIEIVRLGPILQDNRLERILFWPDRKSIGLKQIQQVISQKDETAITIASLQQKSVAVQGLGALEFVLFGTGADKDLLAAQSFRCQYGLTIASALHEVALELDSEWTRPDGFGTVLQNPAQNNETYRDKNETLRDILGVVAHGPEIIFDTRLKKYMGETADASAPKSGLFWRSGLTLFSISTNATALGDFSQAADFNALLDEKDHWVVDSFIFETQNAARATQVTTSVLDAPQSKERSKLEYLGLVLHSMGEIAGQELAQVLGQSAGFSSLDGD